MTYMAISGFGRGKGGEMTAGGATAPKARTTTSSSSSSSSSGMGGLTAFIDQGSEFEGKLSFKDTVRIDGAFRGEISSENTLIVGESGEIEATIKSTIVVISGTVEGNIHAAEQIVLHKSARVNGDLHTPSIVVEEGAVFNGNLSMSGGAKSSASTSNNASSGSSSGNANKSGSGNGAPNASGGNGGGNGNQAQGGKH
jgi:cytoskeletal protein CcmA (bactofilin family)